MTRFGLVAVTECGGAHQYTRSSRHELAVNSRMRCTFRVTAGSSLLSCKIVGEMRTKALRWHPSSLSLRQKAGGLFLCSTGSPRFKPTLVGNCSAGCAAVCAPPCYVPAGEVALSRRQLNTHRTPSKRTLCCAGKRTHRRACLSAGVALVHRALPSKFKNKNGPKEGAEMLCCCRCFAARLGRGKLARADNIGTQKFLHAPRIEPITEA